MADDGENPQYCAKCRESKKTQGYDPPCETECREDFPKRVPPKILSDNFDCFEVHEHCFDARGEMTGRLDYGVMLRIMELMQIEADEQLEIMEKVQRVERFLREQREGKEK